MWGVVQADELVDLGTKGEQCPALAPDDPIHDPAALEVRVLPALDRRPGFAQFLQRIGQARVERVLALLDGLRQPHDVGREGGARNDLKGEDLLQEPVSRSVCPSKRLSSWPVSTSHRRTV